VTREAVEDGFERFVTDTIEATADEFSVSRAFRQGVRGPGASVVDRLLKNSDTLWQRAVQPELDAYRDQTLDQFGVLLDFVQSHEDFETYRDRLLERDSFAASIDESVSEERRAELVETLLERQRRMAEAVRPLVESSESEFWPAVRAALTAEEARALVEDHFAFTWPVRENRDAFVMKTSVEPGNVLGGLGGVLGGGLPTIEVTYTDEAIRAMHRAERTVIVDAIGEIEQRFETS
jgi:hypothetical protein